MIHPRIVVMRPWDGTLRARDQLPRPRGGDLYGDAVAVASEQLEWWARNGVSFATVWWTLGPHREAMPISRDDQVAAVAALWLSVAMR